MLTLRIRIRLWIRICNTVYCNAKMFCNIAGKPFFNNQFWGLDFLCTFFNTTSFAAPQSPQSTVTKEAGFELRTVATLTLAVSQTFLPLG
jgi:hypothetical protein